MSDDSGYRTESGRYLTEDEIRELADEAERGYDIPRSAFAPCIDCGSPVDRTNRLAMREVIGFAQARTGGGQNHVQFRRETGRWLCPNCATIRTSTKKAGTMAEQETLL